MKRILAICIISCTSIHPWILDVRNETKTKESITVYLGLGNCTPPLYNTSIDEGKFVSFNMPCGQGMIGDLSISKTDSAEHFTQKIVVDPHIQHMIVTYDGTPKVVIIQCAGNAQQFSVNTCVLEREKARPIFKHSPGQRPKRSTELALE